MTRTPIARSARRHLAAGVSTIRMTTAAHRTTRIQAYHTWRAEQGLLVMTLLSILWACLTGLLAQVRFPLPFTPVPFTMQVFGILLGGVLLGTRHGTLAQAIYVGVGIAGVPWFQGYHGGWEYFLGPTGGYLLAAPFAAAVAGLLVHRARPAPAARALLGMAAGLVVIYAMGMTWLAVALDIGLGRAFLLGVAPFVLVDAAKILLAGAVARPFVAGRGG